MGLAHSMFYNKCTGGCVDARATTRAVAAPCTMMLAMMRALLASQPGAVAGWNAGIWAIERSIFIRIVFVVVVVGGDPLLLCRLAVLGHAICARGHVPDVEPRVVWSNQGRRARTHRGCARRSARALASSARRPRR